MPDPDFELEPLSVVTTTVAEPADARRLAGMVLQRRLAACVQIERISSHYRWEGALREDAEWRVTCKTVDAAVPALLRLLREHHPYQLPQLVVQPVQAQRAYAAWVRGEVVPSG